MVRVVKRRGFGSFAEQLGMDEKDVKACVRVDCTSMSKSRDFPKEDLSPLFLGPVLCPDGLVAKTMENAWQYSKVYEVMADTKQNPRPEFFGWQKEGFEKKSGERYPMGHGAVPLYTYWKVDGKFRHLDYLEARKQIYIPEYAKLFAKTKTFQMLLALKEEGKDIILSDFDGYNHCHPDFNLTYNQVIHYPILPMGHAFVIAMMLEGLITVEGDKVVYAKGLMTPPKESIHTEYELKTLVNKGFASVRVVGKKSSRKNVDTTLDLSAKTDVTNRNFIREVQAAVRPKVVSAKEDLVAELHGLRFSEEQQAAKVKFDKIYRPFVYKVLLAKPENDGLGFIYRKIFDSETLRYRVPYRGEVSGEVVYSEVWRRLFGVEGNKPALLNFDVARDNVGRGAFRLYLRLLVKSVYYDLIHSDTMILKDVHGRTIYKRDPHTQKYLLNRKGERIPERVPRTASSDENVLANALSGQEAIKRSKRLERTVFQRRISLKYLAYLYVHDSKLKRDGWFYRASAEMFETGIPEEKVLEGCLARGEIKQRQPFDTALSRFRAAINAKALELSKEIFSAADAKVMAETELLDREWKASARKFGMSRVKDVRLRVMAAMMEAFEGGSRA